MVFQNNLLMGAAAATSGTTAFDVKYSCRFNSGDSAYLTRTPGSDGNLKKFTINVWVKRCGLGANTYILKTTNSGYSGWLGFGGTAVDRITWAMESSATGGPMNYNPDIKYRDPNAWYNLHMVWDTAQPSKNSRARVYINGIQNDIELATFPNEDADSMQFNKAIAHEIARYGSAYFDGYLAQYCFIDGSALFPTSFGEFDDYGVWRPVDPSGLTFGTNGFYLDFADSSDLGNDVSGNNNDFTSSGLTAADQVPDTPTTNYCILSPIDSFSVAGTGTLSNGSLTWSHTNTGGSSGTMVMGGKTYWEVTCNASVTSYVGVIRNLVPTSASANAQGITGNHTGMVTYDTGGSVYKGSTLEDTYATWASGDVIGIAYDPTVPDVEFFKNNSSQGSITLDAGNDYQPWVGCAANTCNVTANFGQFDFTYTPPTGFKALNTANLATPAILNGKKYFDTILYEGNGDTQKVGQFQPITESFTVGNSALFIDGDSCTLSNTFISTPTSDRQGTFSWWFKRGKVQDQVTMLSQTHPGSGSRDTIYVQLSSADILTVSMETASGTAIVRTTDRKFADTTQWINIVIRIDGTQTDNTCMKIYINGVQLTNFSTTTNLGSSTDLELGSGTNPWTWGTLARSTSGNYYDGYMSEIVYCDGQLLDSDSFGEVDSTTNKWIPKDVSGLTFGNNGYYLNMTDKNDLGKDANAGSGLIAGNEGTVIGDLTLHGGNAAAFDGQRTHTTAGAANTGDPRYIGKTWGSAKTVTGFAIWSYTDKGFVEGATPTVTIKLYGKTGSAPSSSTDGTVLFTGTVTDSGSSGPPATVENFSFTGASYDHNWVEIDSGGANCHVAQVEFYEGGTASSSGNDFTESGFDTTNGSNQFYDTPTRNFATMDPGRAINETITKGNLLGTSGGATGQTRVPNPFGVSSGKWYFEYLMTNGNTNERTMYVTQDDIAVSATQIRSLVGHYSGYYSYDGDVMTPGDPTSTTGASADYGTTYTSGDVISCALDLDIGAIWWGKNGTWQNSATEAEIEAGTVTNAADTGLNNGKKWFPTMQNNSTFATHMNFGQHIYYDSTALSLNTDAGGYFRHDVPDGFKALHVDNLSDSASYQSAFAWIKNRDAADKHMLSDRVRGIYSTWNSNDDANIYNDLTAVQRFLKQGVTVGEAEEVNTANESYVLWDWFIETTGAGSSVTDGSINTTATLKDTTSGISISKFTGTGSNATVGHGLGIAPKFVILKHFDNSSTSTPVWHAGLTTPTTGYLLLDGNNSEQNAATSWNSTIPTSTVVSLGTSSSFNNSGTAYMLYCFADIVGFSKFGKYTGNGSDGGPFVNLGFQPAFIIIKRTASTTGWIMYDTKRSRFNPVQDQLLVNTTAAETTGSEEIDILANGFKCRTSDSDLNASSANYVYAAFAKNPFGGDETSPMTAF